MGRRSTPWWDYMIVSTSPVRCGPWGNWTDDYTMDEIELGIRAVCAWTVQAARRFSVSLGVHDG